MNKNDLASYAVSFVSLLVKRLDVDKVILFGSVARGDFDGESDIDLFVETSHPRKEVIGVLELFEKSEDNRKYRLEGIKNNISLKVGSLAKWGIRGSVLSEGISLYGPYQEMPGGLHHHALFVVSSPSKERKDQIKLWRELYGYVQKVGDKRYVKEGLIKDLSGKKLTRGVFLVPFEKSNKIIGLLKEYKVIYQVYENFQ